MGTQNRAQEVESLISGVYARAQTDEAYRTEVLQDPAAAFGQVLGVTAPEGFNEQFFADGMDRVLSDADGSLAESELETVSGGDCGCSNGGAIAYAIGWLASKLFTPIEPNMEKMGTGDM